MSGKLSTEPVDYRQRLIKVYSFLKELHGLGHPVIRDISTYGTEVLHVLALPDHPLVEVVAQKGELDGRGDDDSNQAHLLIRVSRPTLTPCPKPPEALAGWLIPGWDHLDAEPKVLASQNREAKDWFMGPKRTSTVMFDEDSARREAWERWRAARESWKNAETPAIEVRRVYEWFYSLWTRMKRDGDRVELVLGDGMLHVPECAITHPILIQRIDLRFNDSVPEFLIYASDEPPTLHRKLLREVPELNGRMLAGFEAELEDGVIEPLGLTETDSFLRRLAQGLFVRGEFVTKDHRDRRESMPQIWRDPVVFVRPRLEGFDTFVEGIIEDLRSKVTDAPEGLKRIVGYESGNDAAIGILELGANELEGGRPCHEETEILFSKPANSEQYQIASRLAQSGAVLVQGPPGTGKTHTIANLIGHLLAQGKRVLVTAHTTKALRVLRDQVNEALQSLCLSVLQGDADDLNHLGKAAQEIAERLSGSHAATLRTEARTLRKRRSHLLSNAASVREQLRAARFSEIEELVLGGDAISPIGAAKFIRTHANQHGWLLGPLKPGILCPVSPEEIGDLYGTNEKLSVEDAEFLAISQPASTELLSPSDFTALVHEIEQANLQASQHRAELWKGGAVIPSTVEQIRVLSGRVKSELKARGQRTDWLREVQYCGWSGGALRRAWDELADFIENVSLLAAEAHRLQLAHDLGLPSDKAAAEAAPLLAEIVSHLEKGGRLGFTTRLFNRDWYRVQTNSRFGSRPPKSLDEFKALATIANFEQAKLELKLRWTRAVEKVGGPPFHSLGEHPWRAAQGFVPQIKDHLDWTSDFFGPLLAQLKGAGFLWDAWMEEFPAEAGDSDEFSRIQRSLSEGLLVLLEAQASQLRLSELSSALEATRIHLADFPLSKLVPLFIGAIQDWDPSAYTSAYTQLQRLEALKDYYDTRSELLAILAPAAPRWAKAIADREPPHNAPRPPGDPVEAWRWLQWKQELDRRATVSIPALQGSLAKINRELLEIAAQIIERETWASQRDRTDLEAQQALMGYAMTKRKLGRGTGKRAPEMIRKARELLAIARRAVPVWIMPLHQVYESFSPHAGLFDVVIIDEASQSNVGALAALYLGKECVVVGDKEQVTPDAIGLRLDEVSKLINTELQGIPNSHLYDGQTSIYDLAETAFGGVIALREHFRCVPQIIEFCNQLSYDGKIRPLREESSSPIRPAVVSHRVSGVRDERGKLNRVEAEEIASLVAACIRDSNFSRNELGEPSSIGVISLLGDEQALLIESILSMRLPAADLEMHRLLCGNASQFQGDERDIVFLSMVDGPPEEGRLTLKGEGPGGSIKKRFNVAASRARNQLWVVHSLDPDTHLKTGDLRYRLIAHARDPEAAQRVLEKESKKTESPFERAVLERILARGYRVQAQWRIGSSYRIDLVVVGSSQKLAVECDGERWHTSEQLQADMDRQAILERLGWRFVRIRGSVFYRDPDSAMLPVFECIESLGIEPLVGSTSDGRNQHASSELDRIKLLAESLRIEWQEG